MVCPGADTNREHVQREHLRAVQCFRCGNRFGDKGLLWNHQRKVDCHRPESITKVPTEIQKKAKDLLRSSGKAKTWLEVYLILFPLSARTGVPSQCESQCYSRIIVALRLTTYCADWTPEGPYADQSSNLPLFDPLPDPLASWPPFLNHHGLFGATRKIYSDIPNMKLRSTTINWDPTYTWRYKHEYKRMCRWY